MSQVQADAKKFGSGNLDPDAGVFKNAPVKGQYQGEIVPAEPDLSCVTDAHAKIHQASSKTSMYATSFFVGSDRLTKTSNAGYMKKDAIKTKNPNSVAFDSVRAGDSSGSNGSSSLSNDACKRIHSQNADFKHEGDSMDTFRPRGSSVQGTVVEGLPPQRRSGELPRGSSSSSGDSPMFEISRLRKSGEISRVSISSGASFSGEIPRGSCSSSGEVHENFRSQRKSGEIPRGSNSSSGSSNGESPTVEVLRGTTNRKSGEIYHGGNSSGGSSSGGSPTPEMFNRGRKNGEVAHGSNSSAGSSDGGSPTSESLWGGKAAAVLNGGLVTGGSFSSFNAVTNGNIGGIPDNNAVKRAVKESSNENVNGGNHTGEHNGVSTGSRPNLGTASRFVVGATSTTELRSGIRPASGSSNLGNIIGDANLCKKTANEGGKAGAPEAFGMGNIRLGSESTSTRRSVSAVSPDDIKNAGNAEYKKGNFSEALALYDRAITLCPDQAPYRCNRAAALAGLGRLAEAVQECEMAIKLDPSFSRAHQRLASLHIRLGQVEESRKHLKAAGQQNDTGDAQRGTMIERRLANCFEARKLRDWSGMIKECDAAIVAGADSALQVFALKAEALLKLQRLDEADAVLVAARRVEDASPRPTKKEVCNTLLVLRAQIDMAQGRFEEAVLVAERAARLEPKNLEISALLRKARTVAKSRIVGNDLFKAAKYFEACAAYTEGLELDSGNSVLLCNRAASRSKLGQWEKALEDCNAALHVQPNYMKALLRRAHSYAKLERWEDAVRDYEAIRREHPGDVEVAQALFDVQVALKKSRGEEICKTRFGGGVEEVSRNDQFREAISCSGLSVVEFTTRWSDRCRQFSAFVDELCRRYPSVNFSKVDVDDNPYLAQLESISSVPTFKIFRNGVKVRELLGPSQQGLEQAVKHCGV